MILEEETGRIKKCPFCGNRNKDSVLYTRGIRYWRVHVMCTCGAAGPDARTTEAAIKRWNERITR
jgi:Lar family restriction alleviation protein